MPIRTLACLVLGALSLGAQDASFRLVPRKPESPPPAGPVWHDSFAAAEAAAKQQKSHLLLYFTARW